MYNDQIIKTLYIRALITYLQVNLEGYGTQRGPSWWNLGKGEKRRN